MKKVFYLFAALIVCALTLNSCEPKDPVPTPDENAVELSQVVSAVSDFYASWEEERAIPTSFTVAGKTFNPAQFLCLEAGALANIADGKTDKVSPFDYKTASNPERDSYDKDEIAVTNGPADGKGVAEDLVTIAKSILSVSKDKKQIPNQTIVYRGSEALAFSTNRAIVTIARALAAYASDGKLPAKVDTDYLGGGASLKAFAQEFVKYLDVWEANVCDRLSADGSACEDNNNPLERVHFIPIPNDNPSTSWSKQGLQYDPKYQPYVTVEVDGTTYTAAQCWEIAIRGLMNLCTTTGEEFLNNHSRNGEIPYGNGKSLASAPISRPSEACAWGSYPWYEYVNQGNLVTYNGQKINEVGLEFLMKCTSWHVTRSFIANANNNPLGMIGNFQEFGTGSGTLNLEGYEGLISPMREFLILARLYKYLLDNNINKDVYDALKDVKFDFELYKQELPIIITETSLNFDPTDAPAKQIKFTASENWTAAAADSWAHLDKTSGGAGDQTINVTVDNNTVTESRSTKITLTAGTYTKEVSIEQNPYVKPVTGTIEDFAKAFVTCLDVWEKTVGFVDADGTHCTPNGNAWQNVHFIPIDNPNPGYTTAGNQYDSKWAPFWTAKVGDTEYTANQCWEIAFRALINMCTKEGEAFLETMDDRNKAFTPGNGVGMDAPMPSYSSNNKWGANPWYEYDKTVTYNGEKINEVGVDFMLKVGTWHVVRSFIKTAGNSPLNNVGNFQEFGTSSGTLNLTGYEGLIAPMREFLVLARIYKYLLDNKITTNVYDALKDVKFDFELYKQEATLKEWAKSFVTCLDVWEKTVGTVDADGTHNYTTNPSSSWTNVHFLPIYVAEPGYVNAGNQYDAKWQPYWSAKVGDKEYTSNQCWEIAVRGLMNMCTKEGEAFLTDMTDRNKAYTLANGVGFNSVVPAYSSNNKWNSNPWYEYDKTVTYNGQKIDKVGIEFILKCGSWHVVRGLIKNAGNSPLNGIGNFQEFGTSSGTLNLSGYEGLISPMRELLVMARIYKYLLDNNVEDNVYDALKDVQVAFDLY